MGSNPTPCKNCFSNWLQWRNRLAHGTYRQYKRYAGVVSSSLTWSKIFCNILTQCAKNFLPDRESNPGLPRDRRRSSPLDYRGIDTKVSEETEDKNGCSTSNGQKFLRAGFEPATYGYLTLNNYSPPLYQLSYRRLTMYELR